MERVVESAERQGRGGEQGFGEGEGYEGRGGGAVLVEGWRSEKRG